MTAAFVVGPIVAVVAVIGTVIYRSRRRREYYWRSFYLPYPSLQSRGIDSTDACVAEPRAVLCPAMLKKALGTGHWALHSKSGEERTSISPRLLT